MVTTHQDVHLRLLQANVPWVMLEIVVVAAVAPTILLPGLISRHSNHSVLIHRLHPIRQDPAAVTVVVLSVVAAAVVAQAEQEINAKMI